MNSKEFINKYGSEELKATSNFATKSLGVNYDVKDAFIEFGDNAYDSRIKNSRLEFNISIDSEKHTIIFYDNGSGIKDDTKLFLLGGTNKESNKNKIGKYGIGVPGATAAIATQCKFDKNEIVEAIFESASDGKSFIKHTAFMPNGEMINGKTVYGTCDREFFPYNVYLHGCDFNEDMTNTMKAKLTPLFGTLNRINPWFDKDMLIYTAGHKGGSCFYQNNDFTYKQLYDLCYECCRIGIKHYLEKYR